MDQHVLLYNIISYDLCYCCQKSTLSLTAILPSVGISCSYLKLGPILIDDAYPNISRSYSVFILR